MDDRAFELPEQFILAKQADLLRILFKLVAALTLTAITLIAVLPGFATADDITEPLLRNIGVLGLIGLLYLALERGHTLETIFGSIALVAALASYTIYMESPGNMQMMALLMIPIAFGGFVPRRNQFWMVFALSFVVMLFTSWLLIAVKGVPLEYRSITTLGMLMTLLAFVVDSLSSSYRESIRTTFNQLKEIKAAEARLMQLDQDLDNAVSERIRAESVSSQLERTSQLALETAGATPVTISPSRDTINTNPEFFRGFGFENVPTSLSGLRACIHPEDVERFRTVFEADSFADRIEGEFQVNLEEPTHWLFLLEPITIEQQTSEPDHIVLQGIIVDVTRRVIERENSIEADTRMNESQRLESLGMLAGAIAHDFNNLLHVIMLNADLARQGLTPDSKPATSIDRLMTTVDRATELCNELLAYSGKGQFTVEPVRLEPLIREMRSLLELSVPKGVSIEINSEDANPVCEADITQLRQVIMNLVLNAGDAVDKSNGKITLSIGTDQFDDASPGDREFIHPIDPGTYAVITVRDNGKGMTEDTLARMFDPFFSTKETGHGLGLSAVLGIVRSHGGTVEVMSTPGKGTAVTLLLPLADAVQHDESPVQLASRSDHRGKILFVDDELDIRQLAKIVLEDDGYDIMEAEDGQQAIELFKTHHEELQLVILDLMMPTKTGLEAYLEIRQIDSSVPVVFSSGFNESYALDSLPEKARSAFLKKPYLAQDLRNFVNELIGPRQAGPRQAGPR